MKKETTVNPFGWVPLALAAWLLIFGGYEAAERVFLGDARPEMLHLLHIVRGTVTSFLLAGLVAWYLMRQRTGASAEGPAPAGLRTIIAESDAKYLGAQVAWIIRLRWIAIAGVLLTALSCEYVFQAISPLSAVALILIAAAMAVFNGLFSALPPTELARLRTAFAQVFLDLVALTMMIYFAGGIQNPFFTFYIFHIVIAGILLSRGQTYIVAGVTCVLFCGLSLLQESGVIAAYPLRLGASGEEIRLVSGWLSVSGLLGAFVGTVCCTAYFTTTIMENLRSRSAQLLDAYDILSQERAKTEDVARRVGAGLVILDLQDRILWSNEIARGWFGSDLPGGLCFRRLWSQDERCRTCPSTLEEGSGAPSTSEVSAVVNGTRRFFLLSCSPVRGADGIPQQIMGLIQDITPMKEMQIQLLQAGKMAAVGQLAAGIAHEINNPLAIVASSAEILREAAGATNGDTAALLDRHLRKIEENVFRCKGIIQNLLGFARRRNEEGEEVNVPALLDDTLRLVEGQARAKERRIERSYASPELRLARSQPLDLQQVVLNLVLNALDATEAGGTVTVSARESGGGVEIAVTDSGRGIAPEHLGRIFEPFFTTKPVGKGTGLGLYLSHRLVEALHGKITVESPPGRGATFRVWLPGDAGGQDIGEARRESSVVPLPLKEGG